MSLRENLKREFAEQWQEEEEASKKPNGQDKHPPAAEPWPVLDQAALHGLFGEIVKKIDPETEADPVAVLIHLLVFLGIQPGAPPTTRSEGRGIRLICSRCWLAILRAAARAPLRTGPVN